MVPVELRATHSSSRWYASGKWASAARTTSLTGAVGCGKISAT